MNVEKSICGVKDFHCTLDNKDISCIIYYLLISIRITEVLILFGSYSNSFVWCISSNISRTLFTNGLKQDAQANLCHKLYISTEKFDDDIPT